MRMSSPSTRILAALRYAAHAADERELPLRLSA
jgi:hypothetical protein